MFTSLFSPLNLLTVGASRFHTSIKSNTKQTTKVIYRDNDSDNDFLDQSERSNNLEKVLTYLSPFKERHLKYDNRDFFSQLKHSTFKNIDNHFCSIREMYDLVCRNSLQHNPVASEPQECFYESFFIKEKSKKCDVFTIEYIEGFLNSLTLTDREVISAKRSIMEMLKTFKPLILADSQVPENNNNISNNESRDTYFDKKSFERFIGFFEQAKLLFKNEINNEDALTNYCTKLKFSWIMNLIMQLYELLRYKEIEYFERYLEAYKNVLIFEYMDIKEFKTLIEKNRLYVEYFYQGFNIFSYTDTQRHMIHKFGIEFSVNDEKQYTVDSRQSRTNIFHYSSEEDFDCPKLSFFDSFLNFIKLIFIFLLQYFNN